MFEIIDTDKAIGAVASEIGGRAENQDSYGYKRFPQCLALTVCDGMGGGPAGKMASSIAVDALLDYISHADAPLEDVAKVAIEKANDVVFKKACSDETLHGMGSTCTLLLIGDDYAVAAHVGDSRIYHCRKGRIKYRTFDHSMVFELVKKKVITEEQARQSAQSNVITRALGISKEVEPEIHILRYKEGDLFALTTDGVHGAMPQAELVADLNDGVDSIADTVKSETEKVDMIGREKGSNHDNLTLMMVKTIERSKKKGFVETLKNLWSRLFALATICGGLSLPAVAQIPYWKVAPSDTGMEYCYGTIYKKKAFGRTQLVDIKENKNIASSQDSITNFSDGFALGLKNENGKMRITSLINRSTMTEIMPSKTLYSTELPFFSEGMVTVANNKGAEGYMNVNGDLVIRCAYFKALPFSEGRAMVVLKKKLERKYIDNRGKYINSAERDEERVKSVVCQWDSIETDKGWTTYMENGLYGFKYDGQVAIPAQFDYAENFHSGYALVKEKGKCGVIGYSMADFKASIANADDSLLCTIDYSEHIAPSLLKVVLVNGEKESVIDANNNTAKERLTYSLPMPTASDKIMIKVLYDGILVKTLSYENTKEERHSESKANTGSIYVAGFGKKGKRADANDFEYIVATVVNNTPKAKTIKATIYVDGTAHAQSVKIKARRKATVTAKIQVKKERFAKVYVKLSNGYTTGVKEIQLKPFY